MGFLDFLKKDQPKPANFSMPATPLPSHASPPPPSMTPAPLPDDLWVPAPRPAAVPPPVPEPLPPLAPGAPALPAQIPAQAPLIAPFARGTPALASRAPNPFLLDPDDSSASPPGPELRATAGQAPQSPFMMSPEEAPAPAPRSSADDLLDIPDFTDDDLAILKSPRPQPAAAALPPALPETRESPRAWPQRKMRMTMTETPVVPAPANAVALPPDDLVLPTGEETAVSALEPAKFIAAAAYLTILSENKAIRKSLRQSDDAIKDSLVCHEQLEQQCKRVAADMNAVQEQLIRIDSALFEE